MVRVPLLKVMFALALIPLVACAKRSALDDFYKGGVVECGFESWTRSWLDSNKDGRWDEGEPPLADIQFVITGPAFTGTRTRNTDSTGTLEFFLFAAGCNHPKFVFVATVPDGFLLTTSQRRVAVNGDTLSFGFVRHGA